MEVKADTRTRLALSELVGLSFEGSPSSVAFTDSFSGEEVGADLAEGSFTVHPASAPCLIDAVWTLDGAEVSAQLDVVPRRYCSIEDIGSYRADQYLIAERCTADEIWDARQKAEEVIEEECHRYLQHVVREGWVDRPGCTYRTMITGENGPQVDLVKVLGAVTESGKPVDLAPVRPGSPYVDVTALEYGHMAKVSYVCGIRTPAEMRVAVVALAALYLAPKNEPENATSTSTEAGVLSFVIGGVNGATSVPEVNALIERYRVPDYKVG